MRVKAIAKRRKLTVSLICFLLMLVAFYVFQIVQLTQNSYLISAYQEEIEELKKNNGSLRLSLSQDSHFANFEQELKDQGYEEIESIDYLVVSPNAVAVRR